MCCCVRFDIQRITTFICYIRAYMQVNMCVPSIRVFGVCHTHTIIGETNVSIAAIFVHFAAVFARVLDLTMLTILTSRRVISSNNSSRQQWQQTAITKYNVCAPPHSLHSHAYKPHTSTRFVYAYVTNKYTIQLHLTHTWAFARGRGHPK